MATIRIVEITDGESFGLVPPCADPSFDHRTCDYWEDADRGSKAHRASRLEQPKPAEPPRPALEDNPFAPPAREPLFNPFAPSAGGPAVNPFDPASADDLEDNPFAPRRQRPAQPTGGPRKLGLLSRGLAVFGSYAKVLLVDDEPAAYSQFGPLSAYPRALRLRELYPQLPEAPLPAVITCIATTRSARDEGYAARLIRDVCDDLARRGFTAVEAYPEVGARPDATSAADPDFWLAAGFDLAVDDDRFPVMRRALG